MEREKPKLSREARIILNSLEPVVEGIATAFGKNCEVVLHSLEDISHSIIKVENGYITGRKEGAPLTDLGLNILEKADSLKNDVIGSYYTKTDNGKLLRSVTIVIRNARNKPIGFLCINIDISAPLVDFLNEFSPVSKRVSSNVEEFFPLTAKDLVEKTLQSAISKVNSQRKISPSERNKKIIGDLYEKGIFEIKGAVDMVSDEMGISRYTVYNYIREMKAKKSRNI